MADDRVEASRTFYAPKMTVAEVREPPGLDHVEVLFLESARFYTLPKSDPRHESMLMCLRNGLAHSRPVEVRFASVESNLIEDVRELG